MKVNSIISSKISCCSDLLEFVYGLSKTDILVLYTMSPGKWSRVPEISKSVEKEESTVHRSLQKLIDHSLVVRDYRIIDSGGYFYVYTVNDPESIRNIIQARIEEISGRMKSLLKDLIVELDFKSSS